MLTPYAVCPALYGGLCEYKNTNRHLAEKLNERIHYHNTCTAQMKGSKNVSSFMTLVSTQKAPVGLTQPVSILPLKKQMFIDRR